MEGRVEGGKQRDESALDSQHAPLYTAHMTKDHQMGHRARLRERFLDSLNVSGESTLPEYELLELILFSAKPRGDMKPLAKTLIKEFGSLAAVLEAQPAELKRIDGVADATIAVIKTVRASAIRALSTPLKDRPIINNWQRLLDYCQGAMGDARIEQFRVFYLDKKNRLISDEVQQHGTVDHTPVYPREVVKRALDLGASAIILVHNHPSGDPSPSEADKEVTHQIIRASVGLGITVHDHVIIAKHDHFSFASNGLL